MLRNTSRFMRGFRSVYASHTKNPGVSGTLPGDIRSMQAAGSDLHKAYKVSGPATAFGDPGRSTKQPRRK